MMLDRMTNSPLLAVHLRLCSDAGITTIIGGVHHLMLYQVARLVSGPEHNITSTITDEDNTVLRFFIVDVVLTLKTILSEDYYNI